MKCFTFIMLIIFISGSFSMLNAEGAGLNALSMSNTHYRSVLYHAANADTVPDNLPGPEHTVKGTVSGNEGVLPGVTITVVGNTRGVVTDEKGNYTIEVKPTDSLLFSFIGMESQTILAGNRKVINVKLLPKGNALNGLTVVAFGRQKKESVVGAITSVEPGELRVPSSNLTTALAGRIAGVIAFQRSGEPGADNANFFIRGVTSFGYANNPLILVDGVEMPTDQLANMQVDDIASFSILKDASATALYGARGANGVILITTKEGKEGKAKVNFRLETAISSPTEQIKLADPVTYMKLADEAVLTRDALGIEPYSQEKIEKTEAGDNPLLYPAVNWYSQLFKNSAITSRMDLNVSGGGKVARYYIAGTYNKDNGVLKVDKKNNFNNNIDKKIYTLRSNVNVNITKTTEVVVRLNATWSDYTGPISSGTDMYNEVMHANPVLFPAYYPPDSDNIYTKHILFGNADKGEYMNPYADMVKGYRSSTNSMYLAQFEVNQKLDFITKGLRFSGMYNTTRYSSYSVVRAYNPFYYAIGGYDEKTGDYTLYGFNPTTGTEYLNYTPGANDITVDSYLQGILTYNREISSDQSVGGTLVYTMRNELISGATTLQQSLPHRNLGLAGRFNYTYKNRYFLEGNFGYNGSERFAKNHRFGFFPSIGGAWYVSNESFWNGAIQKIMPKLKIRLTYGLVGNDAIGSAADRFFFLSEVNMNDASEGYTFGSNFGYNLNGVSISRYANPDITWEIARKTNLGFNINLFNALDITADLYKGYRSNILLTRAYIPVTMGLQATPKANLGAAKNKGIDLAFNLRTNINKGWWIIGRANFTYAVSRYVKYSEPDYSTTPWLSKIGQLLGQPWGYVADRLFVDDKEVQNSPYQGGDVMGGDIKYKDINSDGQINELDEVPIGFPTSPEIVYGFGFSTGYKGFDLSCFFQGLARESFFIDPVATAPFVGTVNSNALLKVYADSHWSEDNRNLYAIWPRLSTIAIANNNLQSTWWMRNGAFLRLKSVEVGYTMPDRLTKKIGLKTVRWYMSGINLLTFSQFKLWDPEMAGNGLGYPVQKVINFGIQCSL